MRRMTGFVILALAVIALGSACATSLNKVLTDPSRYRNREVTLKGNVVDSYSVASRGFYRLRDGTGEIWIVSEQGVPRTGAQVKVTGTIREGFNLGSLGGRLPAGIGSGLVLVETSHQAR